MFIASREMMIRIAETIPPGPTFQVKMLCIVEYDAKKKKKNKDVQRCHQPNIRHLYVKTAQHLSIGRPHIKYRRFFQTRTILSEHLLSSVAAGYWPIQV